MTRASNRPPSPYSLVRTQSVTLDDATSNSYYYDRINKLWLPKTLHQLPLTGYTLSHACAIYRHLFLRPEFAGKPPGR